MIISNTEEFALAIAQARKKKGYTQKELSDFTGYSISYIS